MIKDEGLKFNKSKSTMLKEITMPLLKCCLLSCQDHSQIISRCAEVKHVGIRSWL